MSEVAFLGLGILVGGAVAWVVGLKRGSRKVHEELASFTRGLRAGNLPASSRAPSGEAPGVREIREILAEQWTHRGAGGEDATRRALLRIATFLRHRVESPLLGGLEGSAGDLRRGADEALGAVEDLEFFLEDPPLSQDGETRNLTELVQEVIREFTSQSEVLVKVMSPQQPVRVEVEPEPLKDAIFLILHNAAEFGGDQPVDVTVGVEGGRATMKVNDSGPGFSAEALLRAMDPFYSTSPNGLGLGLPHARRAVNSQGGEIFWRNGKDGGAEVEIQLPMDG